MANNKTWCRCSCEELTCTLIFASFTAALGMLQFGYNFGIISETQDVIAAFIQYTHENRTNTSLSHDSFLVIWAIAVSIYDVGGMIGGLMTVLVTSSLARKHGLLLFNIFGIVGTLLTILSIHVRIYEITILGRFLVGFHCGTSTVLVPMYLSEISPKTLRGALGTLNNVGAAIGILLAVVLLLHEILGTAEKWLYLLGLNIIPSILQLILLPYCPKSPYFLLFTKQDEDAAQEALERLRGTHYVADELEEMKKEKCLMDQEPQLRLFQVFYKKDLRLPLLISVITVLSATLSGVNIFFYYSKFLLTFFGPQELVPYVPAILDGIILLMSIVVIPLIDLAGRRVLHLSGLGGMFFSCILYFMSDVLTKTAFIDFIFLLSFLIFFAIGPATILWIIMSELFTYSSRPAAMSIVMFFYWLSKLFVGLSFHFLERGLKDFILLPFIVLLFFFWIFLYLKLPETKNKTFVEIAQLFKNRNEIVEP